MIFAPFNAAENLGDLRVALRRFVRGMRGFAAHGRVSDFGARYFEHAF